MTDYSNAPMKESRQYVVTGNEDWDAIRGFGTHSGDVAMMTEMMVTGSAMAGMHMQSMSPPKTNNAPPTAAGGPFTLLTPISSIRRGQNTLAFALSLEPGVTAAALHLAATVRMTAMDMGEAKPQVMLANNGHCTVKVDFLMAGGWQVALQMHRDGQPPKVQNFDFDVP